ncbi:LCP family glycopolymer transferase [Ornithinibacillus halophilus]|uniref:Transcriptional attenuator, LytR family n=1 Tax=Ornithinibacillus halophilus TaxID=930117 RepID=A0A1M5FF08_9BACI|nr:LCP family protein [Ornithinibacillus halophilus]SHF89722.1 transcriptional attenuator, LytR family [Ornithinibacillus halophilus]
MTDSRVEKKKEKKKRKWPYWIGGILLFFILLGGGFLWYIYDKVGDTVSDMHTPLERDTNPERQKEIKEIFKERKSLNVLLLGVDQRSGDKGRSDTMILVSLNPNTEKMIMLSIPRDTYVDIPGRGMDKINHAYAFGDVELSLQTVENAFNLPIHFYAKVNMEGFQQGIDAIGGVTIQNNQEFSAGGHNFTPGELHLGGKEALSYIRMRKNDPRGDLGRNERQRSVITAAMNEAASFSSITKVGEILEIVGGNVTTDMGMDNFQNMFSNYLGTRKNIETLELSGSGQMIGGIWYYIVPDSEFNRIKTTIEQHMAEK